MKLEAVTVIKGYEIFLGVQLCPCRANFCFWGLSANKPSDGGNPSWRSLRVETHSY